MLTKSASGLRYLLHTKHLTPFLHVKAWARLTALHICRSEKVVDDTSLTTVSGPFGSRAFTAARTASSIKRYVFGAYVYLLVST